MELPACQQQGVACRLLQEHQILIRPDEMRSPLEIAAYLLPEDVLAAAGLADVCAHYKQNPHNEV